MEKCKSGRKGGKPSLLKCLIRMFGLEYLMLGFIVFIEVCHQSYFNDHRMVYTFSAHASIYLVCQPGFSYDLKPPIMNLR